MRLIYNTKYPEIDENISDCQMGARKGKNCNNNIFIVNGIIHEVMKSKRMKPVLLQIYDYAQMFDSINLQKAINDVFDYGLSDENLVLIHDANKEVNMAVILQVDYLIGKLLRTAFFKETLLDPFWPQFKWIQYHRSVRRLAWATCTRTASRSACWCWLKTCSE